MFKLIACVICAFALSGMVCLCPGHSVAQAAKSDKDVTFADAVSKELAESRYQKTLPPSLADQRINLPKLPRWAALLILYTMMGVAALGLAFLIWHFVAELMGWRRRVRPDEAIKTKAEPARRPITERPPVASLEDADALASKGSWAEALRVLLNLAVMDLISNGIIRVGREKTGREIVRLARRTQVGDRLASIVAAIEFGVFAGQPLSDADYARCRGDYLALANALARGPAS